MFSLITLNYIKLIIMKHHPMWETIMNPVPVYKSFWPKIGVTIVVYDGDDLLYIISLLFLENVH